MQCPKCNSEMETVAYEGIDAQRCTACQGMWFDLMTHERLKAIGGSESIDVGSKQVGEQYNKVGAINCPVCSARLIRMVDQAQPHIWYEACTVCYGVFFDAGEFRDYKQQTVFDFIRDIFAKERP